MRRVKDAHLEWLKNLPAMALVENRLLLHADATLYTHYGDSIEAVNHYFRTLLHSNNPQGWDQLLDAFSERMTFFHPANGISRARDFLRIFGGRQIIHGHTPIHYMDSNIKLEDIREPLVYASGLCMNVDAGMYLGGQGLVYRLPL
jgi:hypothetical protein